MKIQVVLLVIGFCAASPVRASDQIRNGRFIVPPAPLIPAPVYSERIQKCVADLRNAGVISNLQDYKRISELPVWCLSSEAHEVSYVYGPGDDAFRYAILLSADGSIVVVRAGGLRDDYEIFEIKPAEPGATDNPGDAQRI